MPVIGFLNTGTRGDTDVALPGFRQGLRFLSLITLILGLPVALLMWRAARGLHAPPGAGYT